MWIKERVLKRASFHTVKYTAKSPTVDSLSMKFYKLTRVLVYYSFLIVSHSFLNANCSIFTCLKTLNKSRRCRLLYCSLENGP